jgi:hypothetical protein
LLERILDVLVLTGALGALLDAGRRHVTISFEADLQGFDAPVRRSETATLVP